MFKWQFTEHRRGEKFRNPIQGEFFANEHIAGPAEALVREGIQNSLDAALTDEGKPRLVRVRIHLSGDEHSVDAAAVERYMEGVWRHVGARGTGLHAPPAKDERCRFLVFEDFGTTGLTGDVTQWRSEEGVKNAFFHYLRAEGLTDKTEDERGRWGVGKYAFPRVSRMNGILALTRRADDGQALLMGSMTIKTHDVGPATYKPDGFFGISPDADDWVMPVAHSSFLERFRSDFRLERTDETGLSVVVPWCMDEDIDYQKLTAATLRGYFHPILLGELEVEISTPTEHVHVAAASIDTIVKQLGGVLRTEVEPLLGLARFAANRKPDSTYTLQPPDPGRAPAWSEGMLSDEATIDAVRDKLADGTAVRIVVPLTVRRAGGLAEDARFEIILKRNDGDRSSSQTFIREGIIIPDVRAPRTSGHDALVVIEPGPLARLLGDAESPSHTQWNKDSSNFKGKYVTGPSYLRFVSKSVAELVRLLNQTADEEDADLLVDFLSVPAPPETGRKRPSRQKAKKKAPDEPAPPPDPIPQAKPARFSVAKVKGGFTVSRGAPTAVRPETLEIRLAYDCRRGSPLRRYRKHDFDVGSAAITITGVRGGEIAHAEANRLRFTVDADDFAFTVHGFDERRDLVVTARVQEDDDDQAA